MEHSFHFDVRGYELDSLGHVNNSNYLNYIEQARWEMFSKMGILNPLLEQDLHIVVTEIHIRYLYQLKLFDKAYVHTILTTDGNFIIANQKIFLSEKKRRISKAVVKLLLVHKEGLVHELPLSLVNKIKERI